MGCPNLGALETCVFLVGETRLRVALLGKREDRDRGVLPPVSLPDPYAGRVDEPDSGVTLAELLAAFSLATDLGLGQPMEHLLRSWQIASRLGRHVGLPDEQ